MTCGVWLWRVSSKPSNSSLYSSLDRCFIRSHYFKFSDSTDNIAMYEVESDLLFSVSVAYQLTSIFSFSVYIEYEFLQ